MSPRLGTPRIIESFITNTDLTSNQFRGVRIFDSNTIGEVPTDGSFAVGIQEDFPLSGSGAQIGVCVGGVTKGRAGEAFTVGAALVVNAGNTATGKLFAATGTGFYGKTGVAYVIGTALEASDADSQIITVLVNPWVWTLT